MRLSCVFVLLLSYASIAGTQPAPNASGQQRERRADRGERVGDAEGRGRRESSEVVARDAGRSACAAAIMTRARSPLHIRECASRPEGSFYMSSIPGIPPGRSSPGATA
jgi:hypothetical protein